MKLFSQLTLAALVATATPAAFANSDSAIFSTYSDIAEATYGDALTSANTLSAAVDTLLKTPTTANLDAARHAWINARVPYQQSEAYRFGNAIVDEWEGRVNGWPLDEGLIDYVNTDSYGAESDENQLYTANVIANPLLTLGTRTIDASIITPQLLSETLHEADAIDANVATGYHAIEFLLWGQDLNGTQKGAGARPATDFSIENCTGGHCDRRRDYLTAATTLLISDLDEMANNWKVGGAARAQLAEKSEKEFLTTILSGMGSLSYGELAGERIKLGLMLHDPEEEHDCFSDNTHNSHFYDAMGIRNVYLGEYTRIDGSKIKGPSLSDVVRAKAPEVDQQLRDELNSTQAAMHAMVEQANEGNTFDVLIASGNTAGNAIVQKAVDALITQTRSIEKAMSALELDGGALEGSDSLDNPNAALKN
ncbi:imelysin family protein [Neptunomonas antarctica]|uniref:Imelysin. Metallo peptidase. MEROPS family M75 n=1 Tax=Neptunomonas antarctica TaxID=619304 RepID=A0A1N7IUM2_9GAMM|nr:imelysin family protein [Neptunomonas antarctica]SIS40716.1 imelysin. Metallo peptidase. MEROPS family M75 [Neptunomonas antarctica]